MNKVDESSMDEFRAAPADPAGGAAETRPEWDGRDGLEAASAVEDLVGRAGMPLQPGVPPLTSDEPIVGALRQIFDPEIPVNIYDLGLVYDITRSDNGDVSIRMTLTAPGCPVAGEMPDEVALTVSRVPGVGIVEVYMVWDPPWSPERMSENARMLLDYF